MINSDPSFHESLKPYLQYLEEEINTPTILLETDVARYIDMKATPNHKVLGQKLQKAYNKDLKTAAGSLSTAQVEELQSVGKIELLGTTLLLEDFVIEKKYKKEFSSGLLELGGDGEFILLLDLSQDEKLRNKGLLRDLTSKIQKTKKETGLKVDDDIEIYLDFSAAPLLAAAFAGDADAVAKALRKAPKPFSELIAERKTVANSAKTLVIEGESVHLEIVYA